MRTTATQPGPGRGRALGAEMPPASLLARAACRGEDVAVFFPEGIRDRSSGIDRAKAICARCPVQPECLDWAIGTRQDYGVLGGRTAEERTEMRRRRQRTVAERARRRARKAPAA